MGPSSFTQDLLLFDESPLKRTCVPEGIKSVRVESEIDIEALQSQVYAYPRYFRTGSLSVREEWKQALTYDLLSGGSFTVFECPTEELSFSDDLSWPEDDQVPSCSSSRSGSLFEDKNMLVTRRPSAHSTVAAESSSQYNQICRDGLSGNGCQMSRDNVAGYGSPSDDENITGVKTLLQIEDTVLVDQHSVPLAHSSYDGNFSQAGDLDNAGEGRNHSELPSSFGESQSHATGRNSVGEDRNNSKFPSLYNESHSQAANQDIADKDSNISKFPFSSKDGTLPLTKYDYTVGKDRNSSKSPSSNNERHCQINDQSNVGEDRNNSGFPSCSHSGSCSQTADQYNVHENQNNSRFPCSTRNTNSGDSDCECSSRGSESEGGTGTNTPRSHSQWNQHRDTRRSRSHPRNWDKRRPASPGTPKKGQRRSKSATGRARRNKRDQVGSSVDPPGYWSNDQSAASASHFIPLSTAIPGSTPGSVQRPSSPASDRSRSQKSSRSQRTTSAPLTLSSRRRRRDSSTDPEPSSLVDPPPTNITIQRRQGQTDGVSYSALAATVLTSVLPGIEAAEHYVDRILDNLVGVLMSEFTDLAQPAGEEAAWTQTTELGISSNAAVRESPETYPVIEGNILPTPEVAKALNKKEQALGKEKYRREYSSTMINYSADSPVILHSKLPKFSPNPIDCICVVNKSKERDAPLHLDDIIHVTPRFNPISSQTLLHVEKVSQKFNQNVEEDIKEIDETADSLLDTLNDQPEMPSSKSLAIPGNTSSHNVAQSKFPGLENSKDWNNILRRSSHSTHSLNGHDTDSSRSLSGLRIHSPHNSASWNNPGMPNRIIWKPKPVRFVVTPDYHNEGDLVKYETACPNLASHSAPNISPTYHKAQKASLKPDDNILEHDQELEETISSGNISSCFEEDGENLSSGNFFSEPAYETLSQITKSSVVNPVASPHPHLSRSLPTEGRKKEYIQSLSYEGLQCFESFIPDNTTSIGAPDGQSTNVRAASPLHPTTAQIDAADTTAQPTASLPTFGTKNHSDVESEGQVTHVVPSLSGMMLSVPFPNSRREDSIERES